MSLDWQSLFVPRTPLVELVLRGTVMYLVLLAALRVLVRRHIGSMSLMDLLLLVLIADAAQNANAAEYHSITEGLVLCGTLVGWSYLLDWLAYKSKLIARLLEPPPLPVVVNGRLMWRNMKTELLTEDELLSQLRQQGVEDVKTVRVAYVEPDGSISVMTDGPKNSGKSRPHEKRKAGI